MARTDHYAILLAINLYPGLRDLGGPENDIQEFAKCGAVLKQAPMPRSLTGRADIPRHGGRSALRQKTGGSPSSSLLITARKEVDAELESSPRQVLSA